MDKINFGIIGCGAIAEKHGQALSQIDNTRLIAVSDIDQERAQRYAEKYMPDSSSRRIFADYREMLQDPAIDAVITATPSGMHAKMGLDVLNAGKHVLIEKPLTLNTRDAKNLISKAQEVNRSIGTVHPNRYYQTSQMLKSAIDGGRLGRLSHGVATLRWNRSQAYFDQAPWRKTRNMDGGILFNQAWHALDLLLWFMGSPVCQVQGMATTRFHDIETEDVALGTLQFDNGALGLIEATTNVYPRNLEQTISVFGETGTVVLGGSRIDAFRTWRVEGDDEAAYLSEWGADVAPKHDGSWAHRQVVSELASNIAGGIIVSDTVCSALALISCISDLLKLE